MKIIMISFTSLLFSGCMTFNEVNNHYFIDGSGKIMIINSPQSVTGSDATDSLNGNDVKPSLSIPVVP